MNLKKGLFLLLLLFLSLIVEAQQRRLIHGYVRSADSLIGIPNVHIISKLAHRGTISYKDGSFSINGFVDDTLLLSSVGYARKLFVVNEALLQQPHGLLILLKKDTVRMQEVVIKAFYDWPTFRYLFVHMEAIKAIGVNRLDEELDNSLVGIKPAPLTIKGPIQALYDFFNEMARLQRRLERNRAAYNEQLIKEGRAADTIPLLPPHRLE